MRDEERGTEKINERKRRGRRFQSDGPIEAKDHSVGHNFPNTRHQNIVALGRAERGR